jgi:hypothetical protein
MTPTCTTKTEKLNHQTQSWCKRHTKLTSNKSSLTTIVQPTKRQTSRQEQIFLKRNKQSPYTKTKYRQYNSNEAEFLQTELTQQNSKTETLNIAKTQMQTIN